MGRQTDDLNDIYAFVDETMTENFLKLAKVNIMTGEFEFMKQSMELRDEGYENITNIYSYIKKQVDDKLVLSEYASDYLRYSDPKYVQKRVFAGEKRIIQSYKRKAGSGFMWVTFGIVVPSGCSEENPWVVFSWREADTDTITMIDALATLSVTYYKILRVNMEDGTFEAIKAERSEHEHASKLDKISHWWKVFAEGGNVYEEDLPVYNEFTDIEKQRSHFRESRDRVSCRYRRKSGDEYRWAQMDLVPSIEYSEQHPIIILYVKDIHEEYLAEQMRHQRLVDSFNRDALTQLFNRHKFNEDLGKLRKHGADRLLCVYIDVNGLHETNNLLGHRKGDDMLCAVADALRGYFPDDRKYRIGGDEFVVLSKELTEKNAEYLLAEVRRELEKDNYEISAGIEYAQGDVDVDKTVGAAELAMRADKEWYYKHTNSKRRKREMNEELEKMLTEKQDADHFIEAISDRFAGVYLVDLRLDMTRDIYMPRYFREILKGTGFRYSSGLRAYADKFVKEQYRKFFEDFTDYERLEKYIKEKGVIEFQYQKIDNEWMSLHVMELDNTSEEKFETIWIFARGKNQ